MTAVRHMVIAAARSTRCVWNSEEMTLGGVFKIDKPCRHRTGQSIFPAAKTRRCLFGAAGPANVSNGWQKVIFASLETTRNDGQNRNGRFGWICDRLLCSRDAENQTVAEWLGLADSGMAVLVAEKPPSSSIDRTDLFGAISLVQIQPRHAVAIVALHEAFVAVNASMRRLWPAKCPPTSALDRSFQHHVR